jgi:outer membrane lipoprotein carrier protein
MRSLLSSVLVLLLAGGASAGGDARPAGPSSPAAAGSGDCAEALARRVQARYEDIRDLRARFEQTTHSVTLGTGAKPQPLVASGEVTFAKPGRMRWSYEAPEPSLVVSDGETLWLYDPEVAEAQRMSVKGEFLSGAAIQFLLGEGDLLASFHVSSSDCGEMLQEDATSEEPGRTLTLELLPREPASYERLRLVVEPTGGEVRETTVEDLFGNVTRVRLLDVSTNRDPDPGLFRFAPPEGVRVLAPVRPSSQTGNRVSTPAKRIAQVFAPGCRKVRHRGAVKGLGRRSSDTPVNSPASRGSHRIGRWHRAGN